ncbi:MAG: MASE4 domain-containing protein, partial [Candidatus Eremiobacteraeota bacterium]|nr:MASE4 domain-containing protein [Candidatus Eremiobacteraeota bacterium]
MERLHAKRSLGPPPQGVGESPGSLGQRIAALSICATLVIVTLVAAGYGRSQAAELRWFMPVVVTVWALADLMTAFLLIAQYYVSGVRSLAYLSAAYGLSGLLSWPYLFAFPGIVSLAPLSLAQQQISVLLWICSHLYFPLIVIVAAWAHAAARGRTDSRTGARRGVTATILGTIFAACVITTLVFANIQAVPHIIVNGHFQKTFNQFITPVLAAVNIGACLVVAGGRRRSTPLQLWLFVALVTSSMDVLLNFASPTRYSYSWYVGKGETIVTACTVLVMLLCEVTSLYSRLTDAARAKTAFLATMSHEIRTPMNAVIGMTELVLHSTLTTDQRDALETVSESGTSLLRIIDDVLDFSKIEAGKLRFELLEFPLTRTVESIAATFAAQAHERGIDLFVFVDPHAPETLYGDAGRLRQVLTNLVGNALKFTHEGTVSLAADVLATEDDWCDLHFSVKDTGIGIATEQIANIFEPFAQADASTTRLYGGSGLGLSISHQLIAMMGGELMAESKQNSGSTFSFTLRLRAGKGTAAKRHDGLRALVFESAGARESECLRYLRAWGVDVRVVPPEAVAASFDVLEERYDVVLLDAASLETGVPEIATVLASRPDVASARRIFVTSRNDAESRRLADMAGFTTLVRPLRQSQLFDCLANATSPAAPVHAQIRSEDSELQILVAEDNAINQRLARQQLRKLGYQVTVVSTGRDAVTAALAKPYHLILMDCFMPEMDGYAATIAIRRHQALTGT